MMNVLLLFTILLTTGQCSELMYKDFFRKCFILLEGYKGCCNIPRVNSTQKIDKDISRECASVPASACELGKCLAKKLGILTSDGSIDKVKTMNTFEMELGGDPGVMDAVKEICLDDLSAYGPEDCLYLQLRNCVQIQILGHCTNWKSEGPCAGIKDTATECYTNLYS